MRNEQVVIRDLERIEAIATLLRHDFPLPLIEADRLELWINLIRHLQRGVVEIVNTLTRHVVGRLKPAVRTGALRVAKRCIDYTLPFQGAVEPHLVADEPSPQVA